MGTPTPTANNKRYMKLPDGRWLRQDGGGPFIMRVIQTARMFANDGSGAPVAQVWEVQSSPDGEVWITHESHPDIPSAQTALDAYAAALNAGTA